MMKNRTPMGSAQRLAQLLPERLVYFAIIRAWSWATTGAYRETVVTELTVAELLERWEAKMAGT